MTAELDRVIIAVDRLNPPAVIDDWGGLRGETIDLIAGAFASQGIEPEFRAADGPLAQAVMLAAGRADAAADFSITERRRRWYAFSHHYNVEDLRVFSLREGPLWSGFRHFHGVLGVKADSYAQEYLIRHHGIIPRFAAETSDDLIDALTEGRVQAIVLPRRGGVALFEDGSRPNVIARGEPFGPTLIALAALAEREDVVHRFNTGLTALGKTGPGEA